MISINSKYNNKKQKINLNIKKKKIDKPKKELDIDRNILIQSTLVRIMKTKKHLIIIFLLVNVLIKFHYLRLRYPLLKKILRNL